MAVLSVPGSPPDLTGPIRKVHDFLTVDAAAPLQQAGVLTLRHITTITFISHSSTARAATTS